MKGEEYTLKQGWTPPPDKEMKKYIRWIIDASGHDLPLPSGRGIRNRLSKFFSGVLRRTGYAFGDAVKNELQDVGTFLRC